ncbi:hypothetical protein V8C40DRAFT_230021 [Trichoderma camerunense]
MSLGRLHPPYCIHVVLDIMCFALPPPRRAYPVLSNPVQYEHARTCISTVNTSTHEYVPLLLGVSAGGEERDQKGDCLRFFSSFFLFFACFFSYHKRGPPSRRRGGRERRWQRCLHMALVPCRVVPCLYVILRSNPGTGTGNRNSSPVQQQLLLGLCRSFTARLKRSGAPPRESNPDLLHAVLRGNSAEFLGGASTETRIFLLYVSVLAQHNLHTYKHTYIHTCSE